jgi:enoyl-CoA hydratase
MAEDTIRTWRDGGAAWIEINRPDKLNALNGETLARLREAVLSAHVDARVILLTGAGDRAFCAGADIAEMHAQDRDGIRAMMEAGKEVARLLEEAPQPVVAVVNGYALGGGCELSLACDLILAAEHAQFGLPEVNLGVLPGWGGSQRILRRVGAGRAREMILTCRRVPAAEALGWGLCDRVAPGPELREHATALAAELAQKEPGALAAAKRALREGADLPLADGLRLETDLFVDAFARPEREEQMGRFLKR